MTALPAPSLTIRQKFAQQATATTQPLSAFIVGPNAFCRRYDQASEKANSLLGTYDPTGTLISGSMQHLYTWPGRPVGSTVDLDFTRLFCDNAFLRYFQDTSHAAVRPTAYRNRVKLSSKIWSSGNGYTTNVGDRGVKVGDPVKISGLDAASAAFSLSTTVIGFVGEPIAATVSAVTQPSSNAPAGNASATITEGVDNTSNIASSFAMASNYSGNAGGIISETYTVEVITGGTAANARLRVTSASGTDNQSSVTPATLGTATNIGTRGVKVTFDEGSSTSFAVGDKWVLAVRMATAAITMTMGGTYVGDKDRTYIVEVVTGEMIADAHYPRVRVTSQDGSDTCPPIVIAPAGGFTPQANGGSTSDPFNVGSYGLTATFTTSNGLILGDKFIVTATAAKQGAKRTLVLAHDLPANIPDDTTAALEIELYLKDSIEIPRQAISSGVFNWTAEATQIRVLAGITVYHDDWTVNGVLAALPIVSPTGFGQISQLYAQYRAWYAASSGLLSIGPADDLDTILAGPTDPDNPLKYAVSLARGTAQGETLYFFSVGDPESDVGWKAAINAASRQKAPYGHVPLTLNQNILNLFHAHVQAYGAGEKKNFYRVLWVGSSFFQGGPVVSSANTSNHQVALATAEDGPDTGTQYTLIRLSGTNADFLSMGVRPGDEIRYLFETDGWGNETYISRTVDQVLSATTLLVDVSVGGIEAVPKKIEVHRTYSASDLVTKYSDAAGVYSSDLVRYVVAPMVQIGSYLVESYYAAALLAGMRSANVPQQSLSTKAVAGVSSVLGLDLLSDSDMDLMAGAGCAIVHYQDETNDVRIRHMVTSTSDSEILPKREESMVSCRHVALFELVSTLRPYVANINLSSNLTNVQGQIFADITSVKKRLQVMYETEVLGGVIVDITDVQISVPPGLGDTLAISLTLDIAEPGNNITVSVLVI